MIVAIGLALVLLGAPTTLESGAGGAITPLTTQQPATVAPASSGATWRIAKRVTWYGYGLYGNRTACGQRLTRSLVGVAHRTMRCGARVRFRHNGKVFTARVVDRGPYPCGYGNECGLNRIYRFDWTAGLAAKFGGYYTRYNVKYRRVY